MLFLSRLQSLKLSADLEAVVTWTWSSAALRRKDLAVSEVCSSWRVEDFTKYATHYLGSLVAQGLSCTAVPKLQSQGVTSDNYGLDLTTPQRKPIDALDFTAIAASNLLPSVYSYVRSTEASKES